MAILNPWHHTTENDPLDITFSTEDYAIGGKLIQAKFEISNAELMRFKSEGDYKRAIKQKVATDLARAMIEADLIEFSRLPQPAKQSDLIYARCYLAPNDQVKILRTMKR